MNIEQLRNFCLSLPGTTEDIKWGHDLCFMVGDMMFCVTSIEPPHQVSFKVKEEQYGELSVSQDIIPAPYMARNKWVLVQNWKRLNNTEWEFYVKQSYELVRSKLPKKVQAQLV